MTVKVVDVVAAALRAEGVEYLSAYPTTPDIDAAARVGIRPVICRQERVGVGIADGYSRVGAPDRYVIVDYTEGYPYFIQEYGKIVWDLAPEGEPISQSIAEEAQRAVEAKLDESFFRVRAQRTTELELHYLRAMAELGPGEHSAGDIAAIMGRGSDQLGPTRARLIDKGLIYTTSHGRGNFTVPQFDRYMRRNHELAPPAPRR